MITTPCRARGNWPYHQLPDPYGNSQDPNSWGIRVPLMVIYPYVISPGFISNTQESQGAILNYIEKTLGTGAGLTQGMLNGDDWTNWKNNFDLHGMFQTGPSFNAIPFQQISTNFVPPPPGSACPNGG
jgi:hypothetical protein